MSIDKKKEGFSSKSPLLETILPEILVTAARKKDPNNKATYGQIDSALKYILSNNSEKKEAIKQQSFLDQIKASMYQSVMEEWLKKKRNLIDERDGDITPEEIARLNSQGHDVEVDGVMHYAYGGNIQQYGGGGKVYDDATQQILFYDTDQKLVFDIKGNQLNWDDFKDRSWAVPSKAQKKKSIIEDASSKLSKESVYSGNPLPKEEVIKRIVDIDNFTTQPDITNDNYAESFFKNGNQRAYYDPAKNTVSIPKDDNQKIISEYPHAYQTKTDGAAVIQWENKIGWLKHIFNVEERYKDKNAMEYEAHALIEPVLKAYLRGRLNSTDQIESFINLRKELNKKKGNEITTNSQLDNPDNFFETGYANPDAYYQHNPALRNSNTWSMDLRGFYREPVYGLLEDQNLRLKGYNPEKYNPEFPEYPANTIIQYLQDVLGGEPYSLNRELNPKNKSLEQYGEGGEVNYVNDKLPDGTPFASGGLVKGGTKAVQNYQKWLNKNFNAGLAEDGAWGPKTQAAYAKYVTSKSTQQTPETQYKTPDDAAYAGMKDILTIPQGNLYIPKLGNQGDGLNTREYGNFLMNTNNMDDVAPEYSKGGYVNQYGNGGKTEEPPYLNDFYYSKEDLHKVNNERKRKKKEYDQFAFDFHPEDAPLRYCPTGNCLESAYRAWDLLAGRVKGVPDAAALRAALNTSSMSSDQAKAYFKKHPEKLANYPYFSKKPGGKFNASVDSWDLHAALVEAGGKNIYTVGLPEDKTGELMDLSTLLVDKGHQISSKIPDKAERYNMYSQLPIGTFIGFGGAWDYDSKQKGWNRKKGMYPNRHSGIVVGYTEEDDGTIVPVIYDSTKHYSKITDVENYITNITTHPSTMNMTADYLKEKGMYKHKQTDLSVAMGEAGIKDGLFHKRASKFTNALVQNKFPLMEKLNMSPEQYDKMALMSTAISKQETQGGRAVLTKPKSWELGLANLISVFSPDSLLKYGIPGDSTGMTQLNPHNIFDNPQLNKVAEEFNITTEEDLLDPEKSAIATMIYLSSLNSISNKSWDAGVGKEGVREYGPVKRAKAYPGANFYTEKNERVPIQQHRLGSMFDAPYRPIEDINADFANTAESDRYRAYWAHTDAQGNPSPGKNKVLVSKKTKGNLPKDSPGYHEMMPIAYGWQSPYSILTGDATGVDEQGNIVNQYVKNVLESYNALKKAYDELNSKPK